MTSQPNIVLILADDMGYSDLGCFGGEIDTPHLDALAEEGVRLTQFYNTARCSPSRASLLTGRHPHETGIGILTENDLPHGYPGNLSDRFDTAAERLKRAGYRTCLSGKWHLAGDMRRPNGSWPTERGFDEFYGIIGGADDYFHPRGLYRGTEKLDPPEDPDFYLTDAIARHAADFVRDAAGEAPFFLYLAFTAPHWPLHAPEPVVRRYAERFRDGWDALRVRRLRRLVEKGILPAQTSLSERDPTQPAWDDASDKEWQLRRMAVYAAQIEMMDRGIGSVLDAVAEAGASENTLVVFLSDNGASAENLPPEDTPHFRARQPSHTLAGAPLQLGNHPDIWPGDESTYASYGPAWANLSNTPFRRYKRWVHEGGIATPLVARWPAGRLSAGSVVAAPHQLTDVLPTLLSAAGQPGDDLPGVDMLPVWRDPAEAAPHPLFWEHMGNCAVRSGDWKAVKTSDGEWELYDLSSDRSESADLAGAEPELLARLVAQWQDWADRVGVIPWATYGRQPVAARHDAGA